MSWSEKSESKELISTECEEVTKSDNEIFEEVNELVNDYIERYTYEFNGFMQQQMKLWEPRSIEVDCTCHALPSIKDYSVMFPICRMPSPESLAIYLNSELCRLCLGLEGEFDPKILYSEYPGGDMPYRLIIREPWNLRYWKTDGEGIQEKDNSVILRGPFIQVKGRYGTIEDYLSFL